VLQVKKEKQGDKGQKGEIGVTGQKGEGGEKGNPGSNGSNGTDGIKGQKGEIGNTGAKGSTGIEGEKGDIGSKGDTGAILGGVGMLDLWAPVATTDSTNCMRFTQLTTTSWGVIRDADNQMGFIEPTATPGSVKEDHGFTFPRTGIYIIEGQFKIQQDWQTTVGHSYLQSMIYDDY